jgi:hypothetical protein
MTKRPISITIVGWLLVVSSVLSLLSMWMTYSDPAVQAGMERTGNTPALPIAIGVLGAIVTVIAAYGILKGMNWGRLLYALWAVIGILAALFMGPLGAATLVGVVLVLVLLFFLFRPAADAWFGRSYFGRRGVAETEPPVAP